MDYLTIALLLGSTYALIALGYALIYRSLRLINFAHGEFCTVGAYTAWVAMEKFHLSSVVSVFLGLLGGGAIAVIAYYVAYRPLRFASRTSGILAALGVSVVLQQTLMRLFTARAQAFPQILGQSLVDMGGIKVQALGLFTIISAFVLFAVLHYIWNFTQLGLKIRAVADDWESAECVAINASGVSMVTFLIAGIAAGLAGIVLASSFGRIEPPMGFAPSLKAFVAALVGGLDSPKGAAIGGLLLGVAETGAVAAGFSSYRDAVVLSLLVLLLLFKAYRERKKPILPPYHLIGRQD